MRLLECGNDGEVGLTRDLVGNDIPPYTILSHTWGPADEEVTYRDITNGTGKSKAGYRKILFCREQASRDSLRYFFIDTCCIDKSNALELSVAVNSMFRWYRNAVICYVYLSDVSTRHSFNSNYWESQFRESKWFTRCWTLPELLAPASVQFFSREGERLGDKRSLERQVHEITGVAVSALQGAPLSQFGVDERLSWVKDRETLYEEDRAYSLLGIFDISMPLLYGEGREKAFRRLRREIDSSSRVGYSSATLTARDPTSVIQRAAHHNDVEVRRVEIAEPGDESPFHAEPENLVRHCLGCNVLFCSWIILAILSLVIGLWRSYKTSDEGKGFTDAAYVVAVGGLIIFPIQNRHAYICKRK